MKLAFTLSMPNRGSWNGGWSGEGNPYVIIRSYSTIKSKAKAKEYLAAGCYSYSWSDGWRASIEVKQVDNKEAARLKRISKGFSGYDWMVQSIEMYGNILDNHQIAKQTETIHG